MTANMVDRYLPKKRSEPNSMSESCLGVEIDLGRPFPIYQFNLRNFKSTEPSILVNKESSLIKHLKIGEKIKMKYWSVKAPWGGKFFEAEIKHIKKQDEDRNNGSIIVVFEIPKKQRINSDEIAQSFLNPNYENNISSKKIGKNKKDIKLISDTRQIQEVVDLPERRSGKERRRDFDRRSGAERRNIFERRKSKKLI